MTVVDTLLILRLKN